MPDAGYGMLDSATVLSSNIEVRAKRLSSITSHAYQSYQDTDTI
jgi:hypothetical protein